LMLDLKLDPIVSIRLDSHDPEAAEELTDLVTNAAETGQVMLGFMGPQLIANLNLAGDQGTNVLKLAQSALQAIKVKQNKSAVDIKVAKFKGLENIAQTLEPVLAKIQQNAEKSLRREGAMAIAQGFARYHEDHGHFPAASTYSADGKPLLSWRVALLPYIGHEKLYREFKLDEAWNSPHNRPLLDRMPMAYGGVDPPDGPIGLRPPAEGPPLGEPEEEPLGLPAVDDGEDNDTGFKIEQPGDDNAATTDEEPAGDKPAGDKPAGDKPAASEKPAEKGDPAEAEPGGPAKNIAAGLTQMVTFVGKGTIFGWKKGIARKEIPDGQGNTLLFIQAPQAKAVPWTKPADLPYSGDAGKSLGDVGTAGFLVIFADGHIEEWNVEDLGDLNAAIVIDDGNEENGALTIE